MRADPLGAERERAETDLRCLTVLETGKEQKITFYQRALWQVMFCFNKTKAVVLYPPAVKCVGV